MPFHQILVRASCLFLLGLVAAIPCPANVEAKETRIGNWVAAEEQCAVSASFRNGRSIVIGQNGGASLSLAIRSEKWLIPDGYRNTIVYWADDDDPRRAAAHSLDMRTVRIAVNDHLWIETALARANAMTFVFGEKTYRFPITHGERARNWLKRCSGATAGHVAEPEPEPATAVEPVEASRAQTSSVAPHWITQTVRQQPVIAEVDNRHRDKTAAGVSDAERGAPPIRGAEAVRFMMETLATAGVASYRVEVPTVRRIWPLAVNAIWDAPDGKGAVKRYRTLTNDLIYSERRRIAAADAARCGGTFAAGRMPISDRRVTDLVTQCQEPGKETQVRYYAFVEAQNGEGFLILSDRSQGQPDAMWSANMGLAVAAVSVASEWN